MGSKFHAFMYPYFALGHMIPYLHLANKLAEKGHRITFLLPKKAQKQLESLNLFPNSIVFHPLTLPLVEGLPVGAETASDLPPNITGKVISDAMDLLRDQIEAMVRALKPDLIFFDFVPWVPEMAKEFGVKSVSYQIVSAACVAIALSPQGNPSSKVALRGHEANLYSLFTNTCQRLLVRITTGIRNCDVVSIRTCAEIEGKYCSFIERECQKKVLLTGPVFPEPQEKSVKPLEDRWNHWLNGFEPGSVVFCALGSQTILEKHQFQELCLGMELTGLPFLVAVKPPRGSSTIQEALPEGFEERVKGRGIVWGGWVEQPLILAHQSVGCFVNHCGSGSMWESLVSDCQIVFIPQLGDQVLTTKLLSEELEVSVKVHREDSGWFSKESLRDAVKSVMDKDSEIGNIVKRNRMKLKETLTSPGLLSGYADKFVDALEAEVNDTESS
ncbi:UDP-glycosyltransferase 79B5 [Raphanus sativus]|uniref:UDP-glycosyltransferase 79B5-like n=1 Tax=Raphanus sativus TaxID=3726 RepID=A0A6J0KMU8_RAPSA|nr:UDP-glycosyltransferase 79B5-like [Raphanus sativus]KAJ4881925.1 UDP-glycosyltransferase 79B5 [Raphanus sativus]